MFVFTTAAVSLLVWGVLAFGAEYAWAYAPLMVLAVVTGVLGLRASRGASWPAGAVLFALAAVTVLCVVQVIPGSEMLRDIGGSGTPAVDYRGLYASVMQGIQLWPSRRTASIAPEKTILGIAFLVSLAVLLVGCTRAISARGPGGLPRGIVITGGVAALLGILQASAHSEVVFGFWRPPRAGVSSGPFLNPNHLAGWLVMAISLAGGWLTGSLSRLPRRASGGWRRGVLWLSAPAGSEVVLTGFSIAIMAMAMVVTFSRGGLVGLVVAAVVASGWTLWKQPSPKRRAVGLVTFALLLVLAGAWGGVERTLARFDGSRLDWGGRKAIWLDTWRVIQDYPQTGTGLNTFGIAFLNYRAERGELVIEAHNDYLQLAAEGGLLLGIPILITIALFIREVWKRFREGADDERTYWLRAGAVTGLISIAVMEIFDFTLQMPGAAVLFVVLAAIAIHRPDYLACRHDARAHRE